MRISKIYKELLAEQSDITELYGISLQARAWNSVIKSQIKLGRSYLSNNMDVPEFIIHGKEYPKEYKSFPIDEISIRINKDWLASGGYDEQLSGYDNNKNYRVNFVFGPYADDDTINHELRHAFEDYMKISKGQPALKNSKESLNLFGNDFEKFILSNPSIVNYFSPFYFLLLGLYYTSKIERSAYAETIYDSPTSYLTDKIRGLMKYSDVDRIKSQNKPNALLEKWIKLKENYKIGVLEKFNDYESFIRWASNEIQYKGNKTLKKLNKVKYNSQQNKKEGGK